MEQKDDEATVVRPRGSRPAAPTGSHDDGPDAERTLIRLIEPRGPEPKGLPSPLPVGLGRRPAPQPASPEPPVAAPVAPVLWAVRVRGTGTVVPLDRPLVVGRRPGPPRPGEDPPARRLVVPADCADVSARHARIEQLGLTLVVADLGSTNGTVVHWSHGAPLRLRPGESGAVLPDAVLELGERLTLEFVAVAHPSNPSTPEPPS